MDAIMHDGQISALRTSARYAGPPTTLELRASAFNVRGRWQIATASQ
jgi:hypothetical protein